MDVLIVLWIVAIIGALASFALRTPEALKQPNVAQGYAKLAEPKTPLARLYQTCQRRFHAYVIFVWQEII